MRRRCGGRVHDHERVEAVRLRARVSTCSAPEGPRELGVNGTGKSFNSLDAVERADGRTNPMVNPGAIATTSLVPGATAYEKWRFIHDGLSRFAGRSFVNAEVYRRRPRPTIATRASPACSRATAGSTSIRRRRPISTRRQCSLERERSGSRGDGRHARRRRDQPGHRRARGRRVDVSLHARGDDDRGPLRDLGRLALRRRSAGKSGSAAGSLRSRPARAGSARSRHARQRRQQRQGTARCVRASRAASASISSSPSRCNRTGHRSCFNYLARTSP